MKITEDGKLPPEIPQTTQRTHVSREGALQFHRILDTTHTQGTRETLRNLLDKITTQGDVVASRLDIAEVRRYRGLVSDFLEVAMGQTYEAQREGVFDNRGHYKQYASVRKINLELEKLTQTILSDQSDNLAVLEQLGIIRGLLVDLLV